MFTEIQQEMQRADGYIPLQDGANLVLDGLAEEGLISGEQAAMIQEQAFTADEIDDKPETLYDSRESTIAVT